MKSLELKIPPVALTLLFALVMWLCASLVPQLGSFVLAHRLLIAIGLVVLGAVIALTGVAAFRRAQTTVNPLTPDATSSIVSSGIYRFSRNPMYLGFLLALAGWAVFLSHALAFAALPLFVLYMNRFQIVPEERALRARFGASFERYRQAVRRWI